ncbi:hypothetical protein D9C73_004705 [Collichthys lucidus]|uniref:Uncharacterized protein n=1 Tax=Collichthys lucidus TaxID=240159 RepID=A0A4U5UBN6_COLLU|nr:hypothetical protein D9C73_004705 [Collichthys lucidus]
MRLIVGDFSVPARSTPCCLTACQKNSREFSTETRGELLLKEDHRSVCSNEKTDHRPPVLIASVLDNDLVPEGALSSAPWTMVETHRADRVDRTLGTETSKSACPRVLSVSSGPQRVLGSSACPRVLSVSSGPQHVLGSSACPRVLSVSSGPQRVLGSSWHSKTKTRLRPGFLLEAVLRMNSL